MRVCVACVCVSCTRGGGLTTRCAIACGRKLTSITNRNVTLSREGLNKRLNKQDSLTWFALRGAQVGRLFRAIATRGFTVGVRALACFVTAAVVFQTWIGGSGFFALRGAQVGPPFRAIATRGLSVHVRALACFVTAAVVFQTWIRYWGQCIGASQHVID